jgi:hypothetical protein
MKKFNFKAMRACGEEITDKDKFKEEISIRSLYAILLPDTFCILNGDMEYNRNREIFIQKILKCPQA